MTKEAQFLNDVVTNIMEKVALKITDPDTLRKFRTATNMMKESPWSGSAAAMGYRANNAARIADQQVRSGKVTPEEGQRMMAAGIDSAINSQYPGGNEIAERSFGVPNKKTSRDRILAEEGPEGIKTYNEYFNAARQGKIRSMSGKVSPNKEILRGPDGKLPPDADNDNSSMPRGYQLLSR